MSTAYGVKLIELAKKEGIKVTAEVAPHHLCFSESMIENEKDADKKMNPPLRSEEDIHALIHGLNTGIIDCIATDHAPHHADEKKKGILKAPFGITGLETALPLLYEYLISKNKSTFYRIIEALTKKPAEILGLDFYPISTKNPLNFVIFNVEKSSRLDKDFFYSKSINFPLFGKNLKGFVEYVFYEKYLYDFTVSPYQKTCLTGDES